MENGLNLIDGELVDGEERLEIANPATGEPVGTAAVATIADADRAVMAAVGVRRAWAAQPDRPTLMANAAAAIEANADDLATLLTREEGKPLGESRAEIGRAAGWLRHYAAADLAPEVVAGDVARRLRIFRRPLGPVLAITPWNFPISLLAWKLAPALATGNPVIVKPSPFTPLTTQRLGALLAPIFPPGVLAVLAGGASLARHLVGHPDIAKIAFTGSTETGRAIMAAAGPALKRVTLELGGNDAAIVLDDADPDAIAERLFRSAFANCGQVCIAVKRVFVPEAHAAALADRMAELSRATQVGDGLEDGTDMGPVANQPQFDRIVGLVESARSAGATIVSGGNPIGNQSLFYAPTIVTGIEPSHPLVGEEQFGPVLPIVGYRTLDEAIDLADRGPYGLGASIWTSDPGRVEALAPRLAVGTLWVNHHMEARPDVPFGGAKASGIGYENGTKVLDEYSQLQVINERLG